jgi:hypothetical protein
MIATELLEADLTDGAAKSFKEALRTKQLDTRWNDVLDRQRASFLAAYLARGIRRGLTILDILAGTGTVGAELRRLGYSVVEVERRRHYPDRDRDCVDLDEVVPETLDGDVAVVVASLHHEARLDYFIGWLSRLPVPRFVVVENLRDEETNPEMHYRFDWFFNHCLNEFGAECPGWYWTQEQWMDALSSLGEVRWLSRSGDVPGIPFAYDFFEVTR